MADIEKMRKRSLASYKQYQELFSSHVGKKILYDLMRQFWVLSPTFRGNDPYETMYREGQRNVVLYILTKMKTDIKAMEHLMGEANRDGNNF